jgi:hypothetical protein
MNQAEGCASAHPATSWLASLEAVRDALQAGDITRARAVVDDARRPGRLGYAVWAEEFLRWEFVWFPGWSPYAVLRVAAAPRGYSWAERLAGVPRVVTTTLEAIAAALTVDDPADAAYAAVEAEVLVFGFDPHLPLKQPRTWREARAAYEDLCAVRTQCLGAVIAVGADHKPPAGPHGTAPPHRHAEGGG